MLFLNDGFGATSIEAVAKRAGISKRTFYHRFTGKEMLFEAVVRRLVERWTPSFDTAMLEAPSCIFFENVTIAGGPAPARAYIEELLPDVLAGTIEPGRVFDRTAALDEVPDGYRAVNDRESIKVL